MAVVFTPLIGVKLLPNRPFRGMIPPIRAALFASSSRVLLGAMHRRWFTVGLCAHCSWQSRYLRMSFVQKQFFPAADRPELLVDLTLPQNQHPSLKPRRRWIGSRRYWWEIGDIDRWSSYVGEGAVRFYLPLDQQLSITFLDSRSCYEVA